MQVVEEVLIPPEYFKSLRLTWMMMPWRLYSSWRPREKKSMKACTQTEERWSRLIYQSSEFNQRVSELDEKQLPTPYNKNKKHRKEMHSSFFLNVQMSTMEHINTYFCGRIHSEQRDRVHAAGWGDVENNTFGPEKMTRWKDLGEEKKIL